MSVANDSHLWSLLYSLDSVRDGSPQGICALSVAARAAHLAGTPSAAGLDPVGAMNLPHLCRPGGEWGISSHTSASLAGEQLPQGTQSRRGN